MSRDGLEGRKEVGLSKNVRSVKGSKASLKDASTRMGMSLVEAEVLEFIQIIIGVRNSLPSWSIGAAKFSKPTTASS